MFKSILNRRIYLDYASLTPIDSRVMREILRFSTPHFANPSSIYREGVGAKKAMESARNKVAGFIGAHSDEIIFTSGGTESNNLALEGCLRAMEKNTIEKNDAKKPHLIISAIEHSSIIEIANRMEKSGVEVTRLSVNESGMISLEELKKSLKANTFLVSIMIVNNEIGSIQNIHEITRIIRQFRAHSGTKYPLFHTDASQAFLYEDINMEKMAIDLLTLDGGKVYGPRGIGALFVRRNTPVEQIISGGGQEGGLRSGTENVPAIMGFAKALELAVEERDSEAVRIASLKSQFLSGLQKINPNIKVNGSIQTSAPHILNVHIPDIDNEFFVLQLDVAGIACSTKSSCLHDEDESYVLRAIGADSRTSVRFSFGRWTKRRHIKRALLAISHILC